MPPQVCDADQECSISKLPQQLLVEVLQYAAAPNGSLAQCALVCRAWNEAAAAATRSIQLASCDFDRCDQVYDWLLAHKTALALTSISIGGARPDCLHGRPEMSLPMPCLRNLRALKLSFVHFWSSESSKQHRGDPYSPLQQAPLPNLTRLELHNCTARLQGVSSLTGLRHLAYKAPRTEASSSRNLKVLASSLPALMGLTHLMLDGPACTARVTAQLSTLPALQELSLRACERSAAMLQHLPAQLTRLEASFPAYRYHQHAELFVLCPNTAAGLQGLTRLRVLKLSSRPLLWVCPSVLQPLQELRELTVRAAEVTPDGSGFTISTALTKLQHLAVFDHITEAEDASLAALTSSSELRTLILPWLPLHMHRHAALFQSQHVLQHLQELHCSEALLLCVKPVALLAHNCCNLQHLQLEGWGDILDESMLMWANHGMELLKGLSRLRSLTWVKAQLLDESVWRQVAQLPALKRLEVSAVIGRILAGAAEAAACTSLTRLHIAEAYHGRPLDRQQQLILILVNKAPAGSPPDVAQQLPMQLLQAASRWYEGQLDARHKAELFLGAVKYLINNEGGKATLQDWVQHSLIGMAVAPHAVALLLSLAPKPSSTDWSANRPV